MKLKLLIFAIISLLICETGFSQENTTNWSVLTAESFIKRFPNPDTIYCCGNTNHFSWQAGYIMFTMEKMWKATGDPLYYNYIKRYVDQQVDENGNIAPFQPNALDNFLPGYAILFMYEQTQLEKYKIAATKIRAAFDTYPRNSNGLFWHGTWAKNQVWVDGLFMGQIFLARYGKTIGDSEYAFNEVVKQIALVAEICQKPNGLLLHGWDESKKASWADKTTGLAQEVWSEGLGWYAVLLADVFDYLPKDHPGYAKVYDIHQKLCKGLKDVQDTKTGMWSQVVDKPNEAGNWNETSGTGMYIYLLQKSIEKGYISAAEYSPVISNAYNGIIKKAKINDKGFVDIYDCSSIGIQDNYQAYITQPKEINSYAPISSFILGTSIIEFLKPNRIVVWDGETATIGAGWVTKNGVCAVRAQTAEAHSGKSAVQFTFKSNTVASEADWIGAGWNWVNWQVGQYGTDITAMKYFTFWLKTKGKVAEMQFNLLCNGAPALDMPEHHTDKVMVSKYCPKWNDGEWHKIVIPLKDLIQPTGFDPKHVAEFQFFNTGNGDGVFFVDDLAFEGVEMLKNGNFENGVSNWVLDQSNGAKGEILNVNEAPNGKTALQVKVLNISDQPWRLQIYQTGMKIEKDKSYTLTFWVKSDRTGDINVNCMQNHEPWAHPTQQPMPVTTEWKQLEFTFTGAWDDDNVRISYTNLGKIPGQVFWFAGCSLVEAVVK